MHTFIALAFIALAFVGANLVIRKRSSSTRYFPFALKLSTLRIICPSSALGHHHRIDAAVTSTLFQFARKGSMTPRLVPPRDSIAVTYVLVLHFDTSGCPALFVLYIYRRIFIVLVIFGLRVRLGGSLSGTLLEGWTDIHGNWDVGTGWWTGRSRSVAWRLAAACATGVSHRLTCLTDEPMRYRGVIFD